MTGYLDKLSSDPSMPMNKPERSPRERAQEDERLYGNGFMRVFPDGRVEYLPPEEVVIVGDTLNVKAPTPKK
jgi:hypothetical protein